MREIEIDESNFDVLLRIKVLHTWNSDFLHDNMRKLAEEI